METHEIRSPAASITRLGIARFTIPDEPAAPSDGLASGSGIVELPSFTNEETSRPTVQMPPLVERGLPASIDEAFDPGGEGGATEDAGEPPPAEERERPRSSTLLGVVPAAVPPRAVEPVVAPAVEPAAVPAVEEAMGAAVEAAVDAMMAAEAEPAVVPPQQPAPSPVPAPVVQEETLPIGEITRAPAPPRPSQQLEAGSAMRGAVEEGGAGEAEVDEAGIATEEMRPVRRYAWWHAAVTGGALAALAGAFGIAASL